MSDYLLMGGLAICTFLLLWSYIAEFIRMTRKDEVKYYVVERRLEHDKESDKWYLVTDYVEKDL